jgi:hypothetical protein
MAEIRAGKDNEETTRDTSYEVVVVETEHEYVRLNVIDYCIFVPCEQWALAQAKACGRRARAQSAQEAACPTELFLTQPAAAIHEAVAEAARLREFVGCDRTKERVLMESACVICSVPRKLFLVGLGQVIQILLSHCHRRADNGELEPLLSREEKH